MPGFWSPIELSIPCVGLGDPHRLVARARQRRDGLRHERVERARHLRARSSASRQPEALRITHASAPGLRGRGAGARRRSRPHSRSRRRSRRPSAPPRRAARRARAPRTASSIGSGPQARTSWPAGIASVTSVGSITTSALGTSAAASACRSERKPSSGRRAAERARRGTGDGAMPIPPPTSSGRSTSRRKPLPSGPEDVQRVAAARARRAHASRARSGRSGTQSSPGGARHRLIGRGSTRSGRARA